MQITILIPARMASSRFPGKVLADATGRPLIQHVCEAAGRAACMKGKGGRVVVATDDERIRAAVAGFGGEAVMTSPDHPNGTSRLAEAATRLGLGADSVVVNVQGDEPELEPDLIDAAVGALCDPAPGAPMATVALPFGPGEDPSDPNLVKVVRREDGTAMYFSRALIPFSRDGAARPGAADLARPLKHVGLYAYRRTFLETYLSLKPTTLETTEQLEQLRVLYYGHRIAVAVGGSRSFGGIDTPEQYAAFVERWRAAARG